MEDNIRIENIEFTWSEFETITKFIIIGSAYTLLNSKRLTDTEKQDQIKSLALTTKNLDYDLAATTVKKFQVARRNIIKRILTHIFGL